MQSHPQKLQLRLHHNPARLAVFTPRAPARFTGLGARASALSSIFHLVPTARIARGNVMAYAAARTGQGRETLHNSREAMRAPLHPRLTPDPPPASEISTGDFVNRDYESHGYIPARHLFATLPAATHSLAPASVLLATRARGAIILHIALAKIVCSAHRYRTYLDGVQTAGAISADFRPKANRRSQRHDSRDSRMGEPPTFVTITQCTIEAIEAIVIDLLSVLRTLGSHES
ncbi:hypothetical protein Q7P35_011811 [Cladosporium inversicolor]